MPRLTSGSGRNKRVRRFRNNSTTLSRTLHVRAWCKMGLNSSNRHHCMHVIVTRYLRASSGLVLHEEHIELLTPDFKQLKKDVAGKQLEEGSLHFTGTIMPSFTHLHNLLPGQCPWPHFLSCVHAGGPLKSGFGFPSFSGITRLTWLVDLFGELSVKAASMVEEPERKHKKMTVHLLTKDQKWVEDARLSWSLYSAKLLTYQQSRVQLKI